MKRNYMYFFILFFILLLGACPTKNVMEKPEQTSIEDNSNDFEAFYTEYLNLHSDVDRSDSNRQAALKLITGKTYYLDAENGSDTTGTGTSANPWKTLAKAKSIVKSGDGVILRNGEYGVFNESSNPNRDGYVVFINQENHSPKLTGIDINYSNKVNSYLLFYGLSIKPEWVDPASSGYIGADDPQYPDASTSTYQKTSFPVRIYDAKNVKIYNSLIEGTNKYLTPSGIILQNTENITIDHCEVRTVTRPISFSLSSYVFIINNYLHDHAATAIQESGQTKYILIFGNNVNDSSFEINDNYCARTQSSQYHGSAVAIRDGYLVIANNIFHHGWPSSGLMLYESSDADYRNIIIENNLFYDIRNVNIFRLNNAKQDIIIRNNTLIGYEQSDRNGVEGFSNCLSLSIIDDSKANSVYVYNNVFLGSYQSSGQKFNEGNNILWSRLIQSDWIKDNTTNSVIITNERVPITPTYFTSGFFSKPIEFEPDHSKILDFTLNGNSPAINFGNPKMQGTQSLGTLQGNGFLLFNGKIRNNNAHSAGCYEP